MRTQLTTSMLTVLSTNINKKIKEGRFFEISKRFIPKALPLTEQPLEIPTMSIGIYGENEDFFTLKGIIEAICNLLGGHTQYERSAEPYLHPGRQAYAMLGDTPVAVFGELHPETADNFSCAKRTYVAEIWLDKLQGIEKEKVIYKPLPKFPAVSRDFALLCDIDLPAGTIESTIRAAAGKLCEDVKLFDVYVGSQIPAGKKSIAYSATLRSKESTLTEEEIERVAQKIIKKLEEIGAELRK